MHRWQDEAGKGHERVTVVVGDPDAQIRVDRTLVLPSPEPSPDVPGIELAAPAVLRGRGADKRIRY